MRLLGILALLGPLLPACSAPTPTKDDTGSDSSADCDPAVPSATVPDFHANPALLNLHVSPAELDPATDQQPEDEHEIFVLADGPTLDPLFVMLPGTDGHPANNVHLLTIAAESGYRAIGLAYPSETNQNDMCGADADCALAFTVEKVYGTDETAVIDIDEPNSVVGRLARLLAALDQRYPDAGWGAYLDGATPDWTNIAMAGFSQGSGLASWIAKDHELARFTTFSSGCDNVGTDPASARPADWCYEPRATPAERTFGILHTEDFFEIKRQIYEDALGLDAFGPFADADTGAPAYCTGTHILTTSLPPSDAADADAYHKSLAVDAVMPVDDAGVPLLAEDQWYLMVGGE